MKVGVWWFNDSNKKPPEGGFLLRCYVNYNQPGLCRPGSVARAA